MTPSRRSRQAGFTLIELMVVVGIVGLLASVAIPNYYRLMLRSKTAERTTAIYRIKTQVSDYYQRFGTSIPIALGAGPVTSDWNPSRAGVGTAKRLMNLDGTALPIWAAYFPPPPGSTTMSISQELEGTLFYAYNFTVTEGGASGLSTITVSAVGDLDGDGILSPKTITWTRTNGVYQVGPAGETPPAGQEDAVTF